MFAVGRVQNLKDFMKPRQKVLVKVLSITGAGSERPKISLSMRDVDQETGADLRPGGFKPKIGRAHV